LTPTAAPSTTPSTAPSQTPTAVPTTAPTLAPSVVADLSVIVIDVQTGSTVTTLVNGASINTLNYPEFTLILVSSLTSIQSVKFVINSFGTSSNSVKVKATTQTVIDNSSPWSASDYVDGQYEPLELELGQYTIFVTAYDQQNAQGQELGNSSTAFNVVQGSGNDLEQDSTTAVSDPSLGQTLGVVGSSFVTGVSCAALATGVFSAAAAPNSGMTVVTAQSSSMFMGMFGYMQFLGTLPLMQGNEQPDYYQNFYSGFSWTLGLVSPKSVGNWFDSWYTCDAFSVQETTSSSFFSVMDKIGLKSCQVFMISLIAFALLEIVILLLFIILIICCATVFRLKGNRPVPYSQILIWYLRVALKAGVIGFSALILTASFQISVGTGATILQILAWITVFACFGLVIFGVYKLLPWHKYDDDQLNKVLGIYGALCDDFILPTFRLFFVVILMRRAIEGIAVATLRTDNAAQYAIIIPAVVILLLLVVFMRPYMHKLEYRVAIMLGTVQAIQTSLAVVFSVSGVNNTGTTIAAIISMVLSIFIIFIFCYLIFGKVIRIIYRYRELKAQEAEEGSSQFSSEVEEGEESESDNAAAIAAVAPALAVAQSEPKKNNSLLSSNSDHLEIHSASVLQEPRAA
jgi:hypothetical protein